ncbi:substrate-binding domain-containing protein [Capillibacterium thermochitinicola]|uniref:Substrate-binding domain-containing protein n=1 Tax=Capillibacterium thermochitinicola TaxID=2699427 RepID=A0A8J6I440_9FIRM|nr:substrate-binding domain-containing protein [Capillibacterium thermochitinicola]MBA2134129.1 substrate-binding domain-containing protein [Capillibacterium thermochitinicola]
MKMGKGIVLAGILLTLFLNGCTGGGKNDKIVVVSREDGSGTRGAFIELFGLEEKDASGHKADRTTDEAIVVNSTSAVMTTVAGNRNAIGYISLGALDDTVKALQVDGVEASVENIKNKSYKVFRPFNIATKAETSALTRDFIDFILSSDGQKIIEDLGYLAAGSGEPYRGTRPAGKIGVAGSSSVTPVMEKLKEAYLQLNSKAEIEIQLSDSTTGLNSAIEGTCEIAMASRELKENERKRLQATVIALDGLAVIVHKENPVANLTSEQIREIFKGEITSWAQITE